MYKGDSFSSDTYLKNLLLFN